MHSWPVGTSIAKRQLYGWLKQPQPTKPDETGFPDGWAHHPQLAEEYFKQLCAESAVPRKNDRGQVRWVWEAKHRNEVLDCTVYNRAAAAVLQLDRYTPDDWKKLASQITSGPMPRRQRAASVVEDVEEGDDYWGSHR
jgi:phage terminase large subunit GpA-like protein